MSPTVRKHHHASSGAKAKRKQGDKQPKGYGGGKAKPGKPHKEKATTVKAKPKGFQPHKIGAGNWAAIPPDKRGPGQLTNKSYVILQAWNFDLSLKILLGPNGGQITAGYGTYEAVARPRNKPLASWQGAAAFEMTLDLVFLGLPHREYGHGVSVENDITDMEALAQRNPGMIAPPSLRVFGPVPHTELRWIVTEIDWGTAIRRPLDGNRTYQAATVTLQEWVDDPYLQAQRPAGKASPPKFKWYTIKKGDTLKTIAKAKLGNPSKWTWIVALNKGMHGYKLPQPHFKIGDKIKIPTSANDRPPGKPHDEQPSTVQQPTTKAKKSS